MTETPAPPSLIGSTFAGRYRILRKLGEGGQSEVYVAVQESLGREIAIKLIRADMATDPMQIERFKREAATISELHHPHIVSIFDTGVDNGNFYMAMELMKGESLRERITRSVTNKEPIPVDVANEIISDTLVALQAAHEKGVVHRDLKPENIFLVDASGRRDFVKVLDFGIARKRTDATVPQQGPALTQQGMIVGTPGYIAPEVLVGTGDAGDPRVDLYAIGVIWWEMLAGRPLFEGATPVSIVMKHARDQPTPLGVIGREVPPPIEQLIMLLLEKDPVLRPATAKAALEKLQKIEKEAAAASPAPVSMPLFEAPPPPGSPPSSSGTPAHFTPPPAPAKVQEGSGFAGCLKIGCGLFLVGGLLIVVLAVAGVLHIFGDDEVKPPPPPVPPVGQLPPPPPRPPHLGVGQLPPTPPKGATPPTTPTTPVTPVTPVTPTTPTTPTKPPVTPTKPPPTVVKPPPPPPPPPTVKKERERPNRDKAERERKKKPR